MDKVVTYELPRGVGDIFSHPRHPVHQDRLLVDSIRAGDAVALKRFWSRVEPFISNFASDPMWGVNDDAFCHGKTLIEYNGFEVLRKWNPRARSLIQHIDYFLREALRRERLARRQQVRKDPNIVNAIEESVEELPAQHYWILKKIVKDGVRPKKIMTMLNECPEVQIRSVASIGTTYSRALKRLHRVCPDQYRESVGMFINSRQRSGRYR
jgi:hypothetical protein